MTKQTNKENLLRPGRYVNGRVFQTLPMPFYRALYLSARDVVYFLAISG